MIVSSDGMKSIFERGNSSVVDVKITKDVIIFLRKKYNTRLLREANLSDVFLRSKFWRKIS